MNGSTIQMSAPVSPGNSGGPVFDDRGNLVAIVTSMVDKHGDPNAENLNFAVRADALPQDKLRFVIDELAIYTVRKSKIVHEQFFYQAG